MNQEGRGIGGRPSGLWQIVLARVVQVFAAVLGVALMLGLMLFGLLAGAVLVAWALLRGRRPAMRFGGMAGGPSWQRFRAASQSPWRRPPPGEVVDVEAREVAVPTRDPR